MRLTSHELARHLLSMPDKPVVSWHDCTSYDIRKESIHECIDSDGTSVISLIEGECDCGSVS